MSRIRVWIQTDKIGSKCEETVDIDTEEWESMSEKEKEETARDVAFERMDWGFQDIMK